MSIGTKHCSAARSLLLPQELACGRCEVTTYDLVKQCEDKTCLDKIAEYGIKKVPAVVVSGELLDCCKDSAITEAKLVEAGIGQS